MKLADRPAANLRRLMRARGYNPDDPGDVRLLGAACRPGPETCEACEGKGSFWCDGVDLQPGLDCEACGGGGLVDCEACEGIGQLPGATRDQQREEIRTVLDGHWPKHAKWDRICVGLRVDPVELLRPLGSGS